MPAGAARPKVNALTVAELEARVEDPTVALKKLVREQK
jgi:hypothetical protein